MGDGRWQFFIDRGGTFTDVVAADPDGRLHVRKVLSDDARHGEDAALHAMRLLLGGPDTDLRGRVGVVRMGTTVATNALLERKGERVCLAITKGFGDALRIGRQDRPELFELKISKPEPLHARVVEVDERLSASGEVVRPLDRDAVRRDLGQAAADCDSLAVVLVHGFAFSEHERAVAEIGREAGFAHVSVSSELVPELGLVPRGDTTCVDAYLSPLLLRHVCRLREALGDEPELCFMQSNGGLADAHAFSGKDAILSGPAGGVVAVAHVAESLGFEQVLGFDMGGTSTDVSRWSRADGYERVYERSVAGVRLRAPIMDVVTVAAGGGSILQSSGRKLTVGPESAGASPGPACYRGGGPATVTDANVVLGRVQPDWFPRCFGPNADEPLDPQAARAAVKALGDTVGLSVEEAAEGFLQIANEKMARAIRQVSVARGRDSRDHVLACFGGAGAQHACAIAELLGIRTILLHPLAGVLSAHGMALADLVRTATVPVHERLEPERVRSALDALGERGGEELAALCAGRDVGASSVTATLDVRYSGTDHALPIPFDESSTAESLEATFEEEHRRLFGFVKSGEPLEIDSLRIEASASLPQGVELPLAAAEGRVEPVSTVTTWFRTGGRRRPAVEAHETPVYLREDLLAGAELEGPVLIMEDVGTVVVEPGWRARMLERGHLQLERSVESAAPVVSTSADPVRLEIFANRFMSIAEQMGETLRRVALSTNIKERLDYSCALFTKDGRLVANAPHVPVHLGAMGETVRAIVQSRGESRGETGGSGGLAPGQSIVSNDPFHGGSHLPDITVVSPVFVSGELAFFVANRGHHADVGGTWPGSMPPDSKTIDEEGVVLHDVTLVEDGRFLEEEIAARLMAGTHPVRGLAERLSDLRSQVAANAVGARLLEAECALFGTDVVEAYMGHVLADAAEATRELLERFADGEHRFSDALDDGSPVVVTITIDGGRAVFDFAGTAGQHPGNLNAPRAVTIAAVLFVLRSLVGRSMPLNAGCLEPIELRIPERSLLDPRPPAAVAGGNVETSQRVADVLLGALGVLAAGQGTMNNVTFGTDSFGYYETIGGGSGAGPGFAGADAVHVHMTNTRATDVEVLERRYPVRLREFSIRRGSGGAGRWRGGDGAIRAIEFLEPMTAAVLSERRERAPFGLSGGSAGKVGRNRLVRADGTTLELGGRDKGDASPGDVLVIETPGGGGYGRERR